MVVMLLPSKKERKTGMRRIALLLGMGLLFSGLQIFAITPAAQADTGTMSWGEYWEHHPGETQSTVEDICNCTGHKLTEWSSGGDDFKLTGYTPAAGFPDTLGKNTVLLQVRYRFWGGGWHINDHQARCNSTNCVLDYYPSGKIARRDPQFMERSEWDDVNEGMTKGTVGDICLCSGTKNGNQASANGNTFWSWRYASPTGTAFIYYRYGADNHWHAGFAKFWCPGWTGQVETGNCLKVDWT